MTRPRDIAAQTHCPGSLTQQITLLLFAEATADCRRGLLKGEPTPKKRGQKLVYLFWANELLTPFLPVAKHLSPEQQAKELKEQALLVSYDNLKTYPWICDAVKKLKLRAKL